MYTGQSEVDELRLLLQETDPLNSRWTDAQLLLYVNRGRRKYAERSMAVKALFERTTEIGATALGGNRIARYPLDPATLEVDAVRWNGIPVSKMSEEGWDAYLASYSPDSRGTPYIWCRRGAVLDLYLAPDAANILEYLASIIPATLTLSSNENELADIQVAVALDYAAGEAMMDDGRDPSLYNLRAEAEARRHKMRLSHPGPKFVKQVFGGPW